MIRMAAVLFFLSEFTFALPSKSEVRVRLERQMPSVQISGFSLQISKPSHLVTVATPLNIGGSAATVMKAKIRQLGDGSWSVKWIGSKAPATIIRSDRLWVRGQVLRIGLKPVPHELEILPNVKSGLDVVARMDLDAYLAGVLPAEMPLSWPLEALKAQAVAARSFVLRMAFERRARSYDVDSTINDQVFQFLSDDHHRSDLKEKLKRAIGDTRGEVLMDSDRRTLKAFYSADCGCQSEDPKFVWGPVPSFESVKDPLCSERKPNEWKVTLSRAEVRAKLQQNFSLPSDVGLKALHVGSRSPSGRVAEMTAAFNVEGKTRQFSIRAQEFRRIMGFQRVRSAAFKLRWLGDQLEIAGHGIGHGVGLCQVGARGLADNGMGYRDILKLYYPRANLSSSRMAVF